jgi:hypothetical protein
MRFPKQFSRRKGAANPQIPLLGSDGAAGTPPTTPPNSQTSNMLSLKPCSNSGWPAHRVPVTYAYSGAGVPPATLPCEVWIFDHQTERWYATSASVNLALNKITYFDICSLIDSVATSAGLLTEPSSGGVELFVMVQDNAGADGTYVFAVGLDLTTLAV